MTSKGSTLCKVCKHRFRADIELAMLAGEPDAKLAKRFGPGRMSMSRHRDSHLPGRLREDAEKVGALEADGEPNLWVKLTDMEENLKKVGRAAFRTKQYSSSIAAIKEQRGIAELKGRIRGELLPTSPGASGNTTINVFDRDVGLRVSKAYIERHGSAGLLASGDPEASPSEGEEVPPIEDEDMEHDE